MKQFLIVLALIILLPMVSFAAPFLVCDPYLPTEPQPTSFVLVIDGGNPISIPPSLGAGDTGVILKYDVGDISVGSHMVRVKACMTDPAWGEACSAEVPFTFIKPVAPLMKTISLSK